MSAGTYYIKVEGYNASTTGRYTIHASGPGGDGGPVNIPDANLRAVIAEALGKAPNEPITPDEMATLTVLAGWDQGIRDLTGLEFATNLETLDLGENLETGINSNDISNLSPLSGLTNLWWISLSRNSISDISPLAGLTNLGILYLNDNSISDISPLVANTGLGSGDEVYLSNNPLSSTSINTHIPALESRGVTVHYEGGGGGGDDHGDSPSSATPLAVGSSRSGQLEPGGDVDYFRVQVSSSGDLTVHTTGSLDTKGQLEDSGGSVLATDDDGGDGYNFRLAHAVSAGTYYIKVEGYNASTTGSYTIHASGPGGGDGGPVNIPDANLRAAIAAELGKTPNEPITPDEMATLTFLSAAGEGIRDLAGLEFATNLTILNLDDNSISDISPLAGLTNLTELGLRANSISDISPLVANTGLGSGDVVYLVDNPLSSTSINTHIPALESRGVTVHYDDDGGGDDHGDSPSSATALAVGSSRSGQIEPGGDVDYFRVEVTASGELTVHTTGSLDTRGQLEDSAGAVLATDDDGGDGYNFRLAHAVSAGTYYIKVEGYNASTTGSYTIHASGPGGGDGGDGGLESPNGIALDVAAGKMYWTDSVADRIQRANLGGSQVETLVSTGLESPFGIALDVAAGKMYWTDNVAGRIQRANLGGSQVETLFSTGLENPIRIALDVAAGKMYWTDSLAGRIQRANLDGSQVEILVDGLGSPDGIALDVAAGKMYWVEWGTDRIQRANLDGSQVETLVDGLEFPVGIALDVAAGKMYWTDTVEARIQRANLGGSQVETLVDGLDSIVDIALDVAAGKMYWTEWGTRIQRANLDGSQVETLVAKDPSGGGGDGDAISVSISGGLYPASNLLNRKRPVE